MSKRHFSALLVITVLVAVAVALLVPGQTGRDDQLAAGVLLPEVGQRINAVDRVRVIGAGAEVAVTLQRDAERWRIAELDGYPADWEELRGLLRDAAEAEIVEYKTGNPDYYDRLGVEDVAAPEAAGIMLELWIAGEPVALIVGNDASGREGQYARLADADRAVLIDRALDIPDEPVDWAEREFLDVGSYLISEVEVIHPDGDWVLARKAAATDTDFELQNVPDGREALSSWAVNSLANVLSGLRMDSVRPDGGETHDSAVRIRLMTFAGVEYTGETWQDGETRWLRLQAAVPGGPFLPEGDEEARARAEENAATAAAANGRLAGWLFAISESKFVAMTKRFDDLLKPLEDAEEAADP
jgi:hypothetical protein